MQGNFDRINKIFFRPSDKLKAGRITGFFIKLSLENTKYTGSILYSEGTTEILGVGPSIKIIERIRTENSNSYIIV